MMQVSTNGRLLQPQRCSVARSSIKGESDLFVLRYRRDDLPSLPMDIRQFTSDEEAREWAGRNGRVGYLLGVKMGGGAYWFAGVVGDYDLTDEDQEHIDLMTDPRLN